MPYGWPTNAPHHGLQQIRGLDMPAGHPECSPQRLCRAPDAAGRGRFTRITPPPDTPYRPAEFDIHRLAERMAATDPANARAHESFPLGMIIFAQFIGHDITFDPTSQFGQDSDPSATVKFRAPNLDLDCLYRAGPEYDRYLFDFSAQDQDQAPYRLLVDDKRRQDLPRNFHGTAMIGDPRNDENFLISQLHLAFIKFHNAVAARSEPTTDRQSWALEDKRRFKETKDTVRGHYQWIVLNEFIPLVAGDAVARDVRHDPVLVNWDEPGWIAALPVEFLMAAYRFGHALLAARFDINDAETDRLLFDLPSFGRRMDCVTGGVDWKRFLDFTAAGAPPPQMARRFDLTIAPELFDLPMISSADPPKSLPARDMKRGEIFALPSGQQMVDQINNRLTAMGKPPVRRLSNQEIQNETGIFLTDLGGLHDQTPLWFYILAESQMLAGGEHLGPTGGRIVAEVLTSLILGTPGNPLRENPAWRPTLPAMEQGRFTLADLISFAGA